MGKDQELLEAARSGNVSVVEKILGQRAKRSGPLASLRRGPGANVQDSSGYTSLHHAALNGHRDIVRLLLDHDASTNIVDSKGSTALHLAAWSGNVDIVRLLLCGPSICNVNLTTKANETALHSAAQYGHTPVVSLLLEHGCDPSIRNSRGETALDLAAQYGRLDTVELLVRTYPSLIQPMQRAIPGTIFPHTALHLASRNGHKAVVEVLLRAGFDVNIRTPSGTALHEAALCGKVEVVRTLLEHGADLSIRDAHNFTVTDLLSQFPAQATQDIMGIIKRYAKAWTGQDSDGESISQPFPPVPNTNSDLGSPYENVRPCSRGRSLTADPSPGTSPHRWDFYRQARSVDGVDDRRTSGTSAMSIRLSRLYQSLPVNKRTKAPQTPLPTLHDVSPTPSPIEDITFTFSEKFTTRTSSSSTVSSYRTASDCSRGSDISVFQTPPAPKMFMDSSGHSEDLHYLSCGREADRTSLSSTASSTGYPRRPDSGGAPFYMPMNNVKGGRSPGSNSKVSPTPPKKPPRRNLSSSPTHLHPMSMSIDGVSNNAYEYIFLAHSGTRSQGDLNELEHEKRRERLVHGRSVDQYVEMNTIFNIALDEEEEPHRPVKELHRGKSEDLDTRKSNARLEPVAITSVYENMVVKQQNPKRKLRRNQEVYEEYDFRNKDNVKTSSSAPETTFVSSAFIMIKDEYKDDCTENDEEGKPVQRVVHPKNIPLSPTHYNQPPTPDHPPPSAVQAENIIYERMRPLSQEYKRKSRDIETEIEEEYLLMCDESSESFSSSVSLSDKSVDNAVEEYHSDAPFAGLCKGSTRTNGGHKPMERPKTLKKLKNVYDHPEAGKADQKSRSNSSSSEKESEIRDKDRVTSLSPFDEQEEWAKIQEIMASFGTGMVRESVFVSELEKEFQTRLMSLSVSQSNLNPGTITNIDQWLQSLDMSDYVGLFLSNGFDDLDFLNGVLEENDLKEMGIVSELERQLILDACKQLPLKVNDQTLCNNNNIEEQSDSVERWLRRIHLDQYAETFAKHLYHDMDRIKRIWDVELSAVLEIEKIGHRKRILASVSSGEHIISGPKLEDLNTDIITLKSNIQSMKAEIRSPSAHAAKDNNSGTGTLRHRPKKSRPAPPPPINIPKKEEVKKPAELFVGGNNSIKAQWRHQPILLITGSVKYTANYLGSTSIREFKGTESTKKSIQKVRKNPEDRSDQEIILAISYAGVKFVNPVTQELICEHEIKNVNCACQDTECLTYFAYITKDSNYYCHVFSTDTAEHAADIILTLGQAFELAYQMALREQVTSKSKSNRENHKSAVSPGSASSHSREFKDSSRADLKLNGHPLKMKPLTLSLAAEPLVDVSQNQRTPTKISSGDIQA